MANPVSLGTTQTYVGIANNEVLSTKGDGITPAGSVRLVAGAPQAAEVQFTYTDGSGTHPIATVQRDAEGLFSYDWAVPAGLIGGPAISITAVQVDSNNAVLNNTSETATGVTITGNADSASLAFHPSQGVGLWQTAAGDWRGVVSGSTSQSTGQLSLNTYNPGATHTTTTPATGGAFSGVADFGNYPWSTANPAVDQSLVNVQTSGTEIDVHEYDVYKQAIGNVTATADPTAVQAGQSSTVTVTVTDQKGLPIAGAKVYSYDPSAAAPQAGTLVGTTDTAGKVTKVVSGAGTYNYFAETYTTPTPGSYQAGVDYPASVTVGSSTAAGTSTASKLGSAFSIHEAADPTATGNFTETVTDQVGNPIQGKNVFYSWSYVPFTPTSTDTAQTFTEPMGTTDSHGRVVLNFPAVGGAIKGGTFTLNGYVKTTNTPPGQTPGDLALTPYSVKVGEAKVVWSTTQDSGTSQVQSQSTQTLTGSLQLADGTVLGGGRLLNLSWAPGSSDAIVAGVGSQPAGVTRQSDTQAQVRTDANGSFSVALTDPTAANHPASEAGTLTAAGANTDNSAAEPFGHGVGSGASGSETVQFLNHLAPAHVAVHNLGWADAPGEADGISVNVTNADNIGLITTAQLSTDHGYFDQPTSGGDPNQVPSQFVGVFKNDGTVNVPVKTNSSGDGFIYTAIGRDSGLDASGLVTAHLVARDGSASGAGTQSWSTRSNNDLSGSPLNLLPGNVRISFSSNQDQNATQNPPGYTSGADGVTGLPSAAANREVWADVVVLDQFGNRTADSVDLANSNPAQTDVAAGADQASTPAFFASHTNDTSAMGQFTGDSPELLAWDRVGQTADETLTVTANGATQSVDAAGAVQSSSASTQDASITINWYAIDYANSTFTLKHSGTSSQLVNSTVTETYHAVDQKGQPLAGLPVVFYRGGPDTQQDGNPSNSTFRTVTDQNGNAFYVYKGVATGVGSVTAVPVDSNGAPITSAQRDDSVTFVAAQRMSISPRLRVVTRSGRDYLTVTAPRAAAGAIVKFYYVNSRGQRTTLHVGTLNANGVATCSTVHSRYWRGYFVRVGATARTNAATSNEVVVR